MDEQGTAPGEDLEAEEPVPPARLQVAMDELQLVRIVEDRKRIPDERLAPRGSV